MTLEKTMDALSARPSADPHADLQVLRTAFCRRTGQLGHAEMNRFAALARPLLLKAGLIHRMAFASQLAPSRYMPRATLIQLMEDHFLVSAPVLERSPLLEDDELIYLRTRRGRPVMLAIAKRRPLSSPVTDLLVEGGDDKTLIALAGNHEARISRRRLTQMADRSFSRPPLLKILQDRRDLPDAVIEMLALADPVPVRSKAPAADTAKGRAGVVLGREITQGQATRRNTKVLRYS